MMGPQQPAWFTRRSFAHDPAWYESLLGVEWGAIVKLHDLLANDDETLNYQARHVLGLTVDNVAVRRVMGLDPPDVGSDIPGGGAV